MFLALIPRQQQKRLMLLDRWHRNPPRARPSLNPARARVPQLPRRLLLTRTPVWIPQVLMALMEMGQLRNDAGLQQQPRPRTKGVTNS